MVCIRRSQRWNLSIFLTLSLTLYVCLGTAGIGTTLPPHSLWPCPTYRVLYISVRLTVHANRVQIAHKMTAAMLYIIYFDPNLRWDMKMDFFRSVMSVV